MRARDADVERAGRTSVGNSGRGARRRGEGRRGRIRRARSRATRRIGPAHAMADPSNDQMTIYSNDMKSYGMRNGVAQFLQHAARPRARRLDGRPAGLRTHGGGRCRVRGGVSGEGDRPSGARAVDARTRRRRGTRRARRSRSRCAAGSMRRATSSRSTTTRAPPTHNHVGYNEPDTVLIAQLDGRAARDAGRAAARDAVAVCTASRTSRIDDARRRRCRSCGRRRSAPEICAIPTVRSRRLPSESFIDELAAAAKAGSGRVPPEAAHGEHRPTTAASSARGRSR